MGKILTRTKTKVSVVTASGMHMTFESNKGTDLHKMASQAHNHAGGGELYRQETVDALKKQITDLTNGIYAAIETATGDCPEDTAHELTCLVAEELFDTACYREKEAWEIDDE
jgi:hypothetical protein